MAGIVARSAVAQADIQKAIGAENQIAAVVVRERLSDERGAARSVPAQVESRTRIGDQGIRRTLKSRDDSVAAEVGEVHEEAAARRVIGRNCHPEQSALAAGCN